MSISILAVVLGFGTALLPVWEMSDAFDILTCFIVCSVIWVLVIEGCLNLTFKIRIWQKRRRKQQRIYASQRILYKKGAGIPKERRQRNK